MVIYYLQSDCHCDSLSCSYNFFHEIFKKHTMYLAGQHLHLFVTIQYLSCFCPCNVPSTYTKVQDGETWTKLTSPPRLQLVSVRFLTICKEMLFLASDTKGIIYIFTNTSHICKWKPGVKLSCPMKAKCHKNNLKEKKKKKKVLARHQPKVSTQEEIRPRPVAPLG